jgi:tRNA G18 (ribose-2'-O)-methylase SpoU
MSHFGIGIYYPKNKLNLGTLFRSAYSFGASYTYTIGRKYSTQCSDTVKSINQIPHYHYFNTDDFLDHMPKSSRLIAVELDENAKPIKNFCHPKQACYLLGSEGMGIPKTLLDQCYQIVQLPGTYCHNVSVAGSIILFDRINKEQ